MLDKVYLIFRYQIQNYKFKSIGIYLLQTNFRLNKSLLPW